MKNQTGPPDVTVRRGGFGRRDSPRSKIVIPFFPTGCKSLLDGWRSGKFVSWHTAQPNTSGSNAYTQNGAARLPTGTLTTSSDSNSGDATNAAAIESASATAAWARITHLAIASALTGGTFHAHTALGSAVTLANGEKIRLPPGELDISIPIS